MKTPRAKNSNNRIYKDPTIWLWTSGIKATSFCFSASTLADTATAQQRHLERVSQPEPQGQGLSEQAQSVCHWKCKERKWKKMMICIEMIEAIENDIENDWKCWRIPEIQADLNLDFESRVCPVEMWQKCVRKAEMRSKEKNDTGKLIPKGTTPVYDNKNTLCTSSHKHVFNKLIFHHPVLTCTNLISSKNDNPQPSTTSPGWCWS